MEKEPEEFEWRACVEVHAQDVYKDGNRVGSRVRYRLHGGRPRYVRARLGEVLVVTYSTELATDDAEVYSAMRERPSA